MLISVSNFSGSYTTRKNFPGGISFVGCVTFGRRDKEAFENIASDDE
jgi:hypothetical protein